MKNNLAVERALEVLHKAYTPHGILALSEEAENYRRIWSRDAAIAGIAALLAGDQEGIKALRSSLLTLFGAQAATGAIPSNVDPVTGKISYGSLAGRVDATTWWLIASAIYFRTMREDGFLDKINQGIFKAFDVLRAWEFNERHLIYTPLSGNWADEYPMHGYLLYDNCLRLWALRAWGGLLHDDKLLQKASAVDRAINSNFWADDPKGERYHPKLQKKEDQPCWLAGFHPGGPYEGIFDAAGNAFAILLNLGDERKTARVYDYIDSLARLLGHHLIPAFWPAIHPGDELWPAIESNYAYEFKNRPFHFHNGGSWPVMAGWLLLALRMNHPVRDYESWTNTLVPYLMNNEQPFPEYIDTQYFKAGGKINLSFSAAGCILMSLEANIEIKEKLCLI